MNDLSQRSALKEILGNYEALKYRVEMLEDQVRILKAEIKGHHHKKITAKATPNCS